MIPLPCRSFLRFVLSSCVHLTYSSIESGGTVGIYYVVKRKGPNVDIGILPLKYIFIDFLLFGERTKCLLRRKIHWLSICTCYRSNVGVSPHRDFLSLSLLDDYPSTSPCRPVDERHLPLHRTLLLYMPKCPSPVTRQVDQSSDLYFWSSLWSLRTHPHTSTCIPSPMFHTSRNIVCIYRWSYIDGVFVCFTESVNYNRSERVVGRVLTVVP